MLRSSESLVEGSRGSCDHLVVTQLRSCDHQAVRENEKNFLKCFTDQAAVQVI